MASLLVGCDPITALGINDQVHGWLRPQILFYIKVTGAKNIFRLRNCNIKIGPGDEVNTLLAVLHSSSDMYSRFAI